MALKLDEIRAAEAKLLLPTYERNPVLFTGGEGMYLIDENGDRYLDLLSGIGVNALGYGHPAIVNTIAEQGRKLIHISNLYFHEYQALLAMRLTAADGILYALFLHTNSDQSWLFALDARTGQQLWTYHEDDADDLAVCSGTLVLVGNVSVHVFAAKTGKLLWTYQQFAQTERLGSTLSMTSDTIYFMTLSRGGGEQATVRAFDLQDGKERWHASLPPSQGYGTTGSLTLTEQALYALQAPLDQPGYLVALRPQDGTQIWNATSAAYEKIMMASGGTLYLASDGQIDAIQASNGKHLWLQMFGGTANITVGAAQHGIFESQYDASFCSLDLTSGSPKWCLTLRLLGWEGTPFFVDTTTIYLLSQGSETHPDDNHTLYMVDAQTGKVRQQITFHPLIGAITTL